jgi:23S rRNA pseudouridine1911/1915/1917 synthase
MPAPRARQDDGFARRRPVPRADLSPEVLRESSDAICVAKPAGMVTQPGRGHADDTLLNGVFAMRPEALGALGPDRDWGLLHRLDREVSGCVLLAKTANAYDRLRDAFECREIRKTYLAMVAGAPPSVEGQCSRSIREEIRGGMKVALLPVRGGEAALTRWRTLGRRGTRTLLEVEPVTGRLHQIRVHLAALGCPIVGDRVYRSDAPPNTSSLPPGRHPEPLLLHAWRLEYPDVDGAVVAECPPPEALRPA